MENSEVKTIIESAINMEQGDTLIISSLTKTECDSLMFNLKREKKKYFSEYGYSDADRIVIDKIQRGDKKYDIILKKLTLLDACIIKNDGTRKKLDPIKKYNGSIDDIQKLEKLFESI